MKAIYFSTIFIFVSMLISACAQMPTTKLEGKTKGLVTFSSVDSTQLVGVSFNTDSVVAESDIYNLRHHLDECLEKKVHQLEWGKGIHRDFNLFFKISGSIQDVASTIEERGATTSSEISWIWAGAQNPDILIHLDKDGTGYLRLYNSDGLTVGYTTCRSMAGNGRPTEGECKIVKVWKNPAPAEYIENDQKPTVGRASISFDSWMPWALETNNSKQGIFIHGGSQATSSKGCIRLPKKFAEMLHGIVNIGTKVVIDLAN